MTHIGKLALYRHNKEKLVRPYRHMALVTEQYDDCIICVPFNAKSDQDFFYLGIDGGLDKYYTLTMVEFDDFSVTWDIHSRDVDHHPWLAP